VEAVCVHNDIGEVFEDEHVMIVAEIRHAAEVFEENKRTVFGVVRVGGMSAE
jgi:hypothetical protein